MNLIETVNGLATTLNEKNLSVISIKSGDLEIQLAAKQAAPVSYTTPAGVPVAVSVPVAPAAEEIAPVVKDGTFIKSPIVGTFYSAPAPDKAPYVKAGDKVTKGQVVCIVESMKVMNEITSDYDGTVAEILVKDGEAVDFGKELIMLD
ncbi:MAG: acetyl-CoA carboxylase biotin carboxyl carrier protein [Oscillospiraceae bacterium]|nr:acetyl-CoA carboxylase biotin carboxyl carrier protein [Oscillospiraceae bacterium]